MCKITVLTKINKEKNLLYNYFIYIYIYIYIYITIYYIYIYIYDYLFCKNMTVFFI